MEQESKLKNFVRNFIIFICSSVSLCFIAIGLGFLLIHNRGALDFTILISSTCILSFLFLLPCIIIKKKKEHRTSLFQKIICLLVILIEIGTVTVFLLPPKKFTLVLTEDANIRSEPNTDSPIIKMEKKGVTFDETIISDSPDWYKVKIDETDGYVHKSVGKDLKKLQKEEEAKKNIKKQSSSDDPSTLSIIIVIVVIIIILDLLGKFFSGPFTRCPSCKKWWAREELGRELIDSKESLETVTKKFDIKRDGQQTGEYIDMPVTVHMETNYYLNHCRCKKCGYTWAYRTRSKREV